MIASYIQCTSIQLWYSYVLSYKLFNCYIQNRVNASTISNRPYETIANGLAKLVASPQLHEELAVHPEEATKLGKDEAPGMQDTAFLYSLAPFPMRGTLDAINVWLGFASN